MVTSCSITTTKIKDPVFNDNDKIEKELKSLVNPEHINLNGKEITTNKKTTSELEISIINGSNIPTTDEERTALEKSIAKCIKRNLKYPNEFDTYRVLFVSSVESGGVTTRTSTGDVFNSTEL
jgi:hypothetical protein